MQSADFTYILILICAMLALWLVAKLLPKEEMYESDEPTKEGE